jgi:hypothetical protein
MRDLGWVRPCSCGESVTADPMDPTPRYRAHVEAPAHRAWSDATSLIPRVPLDSTACRVTVNLSRVATVRPVRRPRGRVGVR